MGKKIEKKWIFFIFRKKIAELEWKNEKKW